MQHRISTWTDSEPIPELKHLFADFLENRKKEILQLTANVENRNFSQISAVCHGWKGFAAPYGFSSLVGFADELSTAANEENAEACNTIIATIEVYLNSKLQ